LFIETLGRRGLGGGAVRVLVEDLKNQFPILDPSHLTAAQQNDLKKAFGRLMRRETYNVFSELGLPEPNREYSNIDPDEISLKKVLPDRRELDKIIFEAIGLNEAEQLEVYREMVILAKNRLIKAQSV
jgi:hypothetical protein